MTDLPKSGVFSTNWTVFFRIRIYQTVPYEAMVHHFGRHGCEQLIWVKLLRYGYKLRVGALISGLWWGTKIFSFTIYIVFLVCIIFFTTLPLIGIRLERASDAEMKINRRLLISRFPMKILSSLWNDKIIIWSTWPISVMLFIHCIMLPVIYRRRRKW